MCACDCWVFGMSFLDISPMKSRVGHNNLKILSRLVFRYPDKQNLEQFGTGFGQFEGSWTQTADILLEHMMTKKKNQTNKNKKKPKQTKDFW